MEAEGGIESTGLLSKTFRKQRETGDERNVPAAPVIPMVTGVSAAIVTASHACANQDISEQDGSKLNISSNIRTSIDQPV